MPLARWLLALALSAPLCGCSGVRPAGLGAPGGRLRACASTPNCVSSQAPADDEEHYIAPLPYSGPLPAAWERLVRILEDELSRVEVITRTERYLHAEATSLIFRFVDDLELYAPEGEPLIHVRSGARLGRSDFGVNRSRVEEIRELFAAPPR